MAAWPAPTFAGFAVIDTETTGLFPHGGHDRIVEIAVIDLDPWLRSVTEWSTLVNPCRDVGPTSIHGITASQVADAPRFCEVLGDVVEHLADRVVVGHNIRFDLSFLDEEFSQAGYRVAWPAGLCTMALASSLAGARRLDACCQEFGIDTGRSHSALCDARATAELFARCLERLGKSAPQLPPPVARQCLPPVAPSGRHVDRGAVPLPQRTNLSSLVDRLPLEGMSADAHSEAAMAYVDLLDRVLEDRRLTPDEVSALSQLASAWGLSSSAAAQIHRYYFSGLARLALADGILTDIEREDLRVTAGLLGVADELQDLRTAASAPAVIVNRASELRGKTVCFTGESVCSINGVPLDRAHQQQLAAAAGLLPVESVTRRCDILVLADAASMSGKAKKADEYGVRKIAEFSFWAGLGLRVDGS
jgi:DNA polymerase-3 subunit epsilon